MMVVMLMIEVEMVILRIETVIMMMEMMGIMGMEMVMMNGGADEGEIVIMMVEMVVVKAGVVIMW